MRHCRLYVFLIAALVLTECILAIESTDRKAIHLPTSAELPRKLKSSRREGRFLGLLGLLTGLTLVDSLDDDNDRPRRSGFVKIDVGHPAALDAFYGAYGYSSPYWTGGSTINIKIPFRPPGAEFETMAVIPFPVHFPHTGPSHYGSAPGGIEPRPTIFSDPVPSASNGSETIAADELELPRGRKQKLASKKSSTTVKRRSRPKVSPPRTIRSTLRADAEPNEETNVETVEETTTTSDTPTVLAPTELTASNDPDVSATNTPTDHYAPVSEDPEPATPASIVQSELNYVTQPMIPASYYTHQHSLADLSAIELTTTASTQDFPLAAFQPSRADHWQDYYGTVAQESSNRQLGFLPIAPPAH
ncbi:uncharacterized protein LOC120902648 [Anopheles arabiensis]|uniref:Uncharacterized protein n=2 Tax=gambiae species complex TaxID=44542 RepID=A0A1S4HDT2_ANOGA|nr:uncharacterized protein LOC120902648 [Anopheles arabiensis]